MILLPMVVVINLTYSSQHKQTLEYRSNTMLNKTLCFDVPSLVTSFNQSCALLQHGIATLL